MKIPGGTASWTVQTEGYELYDNFGMISKDGEENAFYRVLTIQKDLT